jgi:hypothetical protein
VTLADTSSNTEGSDEQEKAAKEKMEAEKQAAGEEKAKEGESLPDLRSIVGKTWALDSSKGQPPSPRRGKKAQAGSSGDERDFFRIAHGVSVEGIG